MFKILLIVFLSWAFYVAPNLLFKNKNIKEVTNKFFQIFPQTFLYIFGNSFYYLTISCNWLFEYLEDINFDASKASVRNIKKKLNVSHSEAYAIYKKYNEVTKQKSKKHLQILSPYEMDGEKETIAETSQKQAINKPKTTEKQ